MVFSDFRVFAVATIVGMALHLKTKGPGLLTQLPGSSEMIEMVVLITKI